MENIKSVVVNIIFLIQIYYIKTNKVYFTNTTSTWESGRSACKLVGQGSNVPLEDIRVIQDPKYNQSSSTYGWIDALAAYQPWMEYLGCCVINPSLIQKEVNVSSSTQLLDCLDQCQGSTYIGLKQSTCVCLANLTLGYPDTTGTCTSQFCTGDDYALCTSDTTGYGYAVYTRGTRPVTQNIGDCLVLTINRNLAAPVYYEPAPCGTTFYPLCYNGFPIPLYNNKQTWNGAVTACLAYSAVLTSPYQITGTSISTTDGSYWLAQIRKYKFQLTKDFVPGIENYCLAARIATTDGSLQPLIRSCDSNLQSICYSEISSGNDITTNDLELVTFSVTPTNATKEPVPTTISDGTIALLIFLPGFLIVTAVVIAGICIWRQYKRKARNKESFINQTTDTTYYSTPEGFGPIVDDHNDLEPDQYARNNPSNYDCVDEQKIAPSFTETDDMYARTDDQVVKTTSRSQDETYTYDHITRSRTSNNDGYGYDTMASIGNGYHVVNSENFTNDTVSYHKIASTEPRDKSDIYDCADTPEVTDKSNQYDTVPDF